MSLTCTVKPDDITLPATPKITELGIDSIKRVEILSEVQSQLNVEAQDVDALSRTRTVGEVIAAMINEINGGAGGNSNSSVPAASNNNGNSGGTLATGSALVAEAECNGPEEHLGDVVYTN